MMSCLFLTTAPLNKDCFCIHENCPYCSSLPLFPNSHPNSSTCSHEGNFRCSCIYVNTNSLGSLIYCPWLVQLLSLHSFLMPHFLDLSCHLHILIFSRLGFFASLLLFCNILILQNCVLLQNYRICFQVSKHALVR